MEVRRELLGGASLTCAELHDSEVSERRSPVPGSSRRSLTGSTWREECM